MSSVIASSDKYTVPPETRDFCLSMLLPSPARRRMHVPFQVHLTPTLIEPASHRSLPLAFMPRIVSVHSHNKQETSPKLVTYQPPLPPFDFSLARSRQAQHSLAVASRWSRAPSRQLPNNPLPIPPPLLVPPSAVLLPEQVYPCAAAQGCSEMRTVSSREQRPQTRTWVV
jgi:hypothetical protein